MLKKFQAGKNKIIGVALNYQGLFKEWQEKFNEIPYHAEPKRPILFIKTPNTVNKNNGIVYQSKKEVLQAGPSLGIIFSKKTCRVSENEAINYVAGLVIVNEFSLSEKSFYRPAIKSKCQDGFCSISENIIKLKNINDLNNLNIKLFINKKLKQENNTKNLIYKIEQLISLISEFMTFESGDLLITGTPEGRINLNPNDKVCIQIENLGELNNLIKEK